MAVSFCSVLVPKLQNRFPERRFELYPEESRFLVYPCEHPDVGDLEIFDDGNEVTVLIGRFTHAHFDCYDKGVSESEKVTRICDDVVDFLEELFADRLELYGSHSRGGGCRAIRGKKRGVLSRALFGRDSFVWSGPLN